MADPVNHPFLAVERAVPTEGLGTEWALFGANGQIAASYRTHGPIVKAWMYSKYDSAIEAYHILNSENVARLFCEEVAKGRGWIPPPVEMPDLDTIFKSFNQ